MEYLSKSNRDKIWTIDIETDDLKATIIWLLCAKNLGTGEERSITDYDEMRLFLHELIQDKEVIFVGHNGIKFDFVVIAKLLGVSIPINRVVDTFLLSMVYNPSLEGGHSLQSWGLRLRMPKGDFHDFSKYSPEMLMYCLQDVRITSVLYDKITDRMKQLRFTEEGIQIEHLSWNIIRQQTTAGFKFNYEGAVELYVKLRNIENSIKEEIYEHWPPQLLVVKSFKQSTKKDGEPTANYLKHEAVYPKLEVKPDGTYDAYDYVEFNLGSPPQRVQKLLELGWEPKEFTKPSKTNPNGSPQPTTKGSLSPSLQAFVEANDLPQVKALARWITINSRAGMLNTWMEAYDRTTGCIHGSLYLANTLRYRHSAPNSANIPAVRVGKDDHPLMEDAGDWCYESRDLWTTRDPSNRCMVGVDAKGIQLRVLAHYLNNPDFTKAVLDGDPHSYNQSVGGFRTRAIAKTFIYAFLLGCGDAKAGSIIGGSTKDGREVKSRFIDNFPGLRELLESLKKQVERTGRIRLCDGIPILVSSPHMVLGYLLQGDESRIMKLASIYVQRKIRRESLDAIKVGDIHDEWQYDLDRRHVDRFVELCSGAFREAGEHFNYRVPIECDAKVGMSWAQTH